MSTLIHVVMCSDAHQDCVSSAHRTQAGAEAAMRRYLAETWPTYAARNVDLPEAPPADRREAAELLGEAGCHYWLECVELAA